MRYLILLLSCAAWGQTQFIAGAVGDYATYPSTALIANSYSGISTVATLSTASLKGGTCGYVATAAGATKTLQNIHVMIGAVTKTGGTDLRIGIQATSSTTGPPMQPDGSWAATGAAFATVADGSITANTWLRSGTVGGALSVANGDILCIVVEPENYAGSDSYVIRGVGTKTNYTSIPVSYNGSAWSIPGGIGAMLHMLEFTDGTFGSVGLGLPLNTVGTSVTYNSGSTPDEIALKVQPSMSMLVVGMCSENPYSTSTGDFEWVLYNGTTAMVTVSIDVNRLYSTGASTAVCAYFTSAQTLTAGGTYYAALKPTTANNISIKYNAVSDASYWAVYGGGTGMGYSTRTDAGSWSDTATRRPTIWLLVSGVVTGSGSTAGAYVVAQ